MVSKNIKIPAYISMGLHIAVFTIALLVISLQEQIIKLYGIRGIEGIHVFPPSIVGLGLGMILSIILVVIIKDYQGDRRRGICIALFATMIGIGIIMLPVNLITQQIYARVWGADHLAVFASVGNALNLWTAPLQLAAAPFYYVALGRYGISKKED